MRIRIKYKKKTDSKVVARKKNKARIRKKVAGTSERPRMAVFRSGRYLYAQLIDDVTGKTLMATSSLKLGLEGSKKSVEAAKAVGMDLAKKALEKNIKNIVFDRSGYVYHGRIQAVAEGAREAGLIF